MTLSEWTRTCSYHFVTFPTTKAFQDHWEMCSVRIQAGLIDEDLGGHA